MNVPRYPVASTRGVVSTPHYLATATGLRVMQEGGNAIDAAIAANAVLGVVEPAMCGIGGDLFMLIHTPATGLAALNGSGRSPYGVDLEWFQSKGITAMPTSGPYTVSVPGVVDGWLTAHQRFGSKPFADLLSHAISYAAEGHPLRRHTWETIGHTRKLMAEHPVSAEVYLRNGEAPPMGATIRNPALAESLRMVAADGRRAVYEGGELGHAIVKTCNDLGWPLSHRDLEEQHAEWVTPISSHYRGHTVYEMPPPNQGMATLITLNILDGLDLKALGRDHPDTVHLQVEAKRAAFVLRNSLCVDPTFYDVPLDILLSSGQADELRSKIDRGNATAPAVAAAALANAGPQRNDGDTIYMTTADGQGNYVSLIQSNYSAWGSGVMAGNRGFFLQNRGAGFVLDPGHANRYEPHRRPFHTLIPAMAYKDNRPWLLFGTRGADAQPQTQVQIVCNMVDFGLNVQEALDAPRWRLSGTYHRPLPDNLLLESRFPSETLAGLQAKGHPAAWSAAADDGMGHAAAIEIGADGVLYAAYDLRSDGVALGW